MDLERLGLREKRYSGIHGDIGVYITLLARAIVTRYLQSASPTLVDLLTCDVSSKEYDSFTSNMQHEMASAFQVENNRRVLYKTINLTTVDLSEYVPSQISLSFSPEDASILSTLQSGRWSPFTKYGLEINPLNLGCLWGNRWLNDHAMNFFLQLVEIRSQKDGAPARVKCMNTFFYTKLASNGYNFGNVASWFLDTDLFALDFIFVPIHVGLVR
jgi:Ulp1 family protease